MNVSTIISTDSLAEMVSQLGDIELGRIRMQPLPGLATAEDVESIHAHENRLFELVDGILVEKVMGFRESLIAVAIASILKSFVASKNLGLVVGADGMTQLFSRTVRIPDVAFIAWDQLPDGKVPEAAIPDLAPTLAVEVLSASNTAGEMSRKRAEYFAAGVKLVWEVDIDRRIVTVYTSPNHFTVTKQGDKLSAEETIPGLMIPVSDIFAELDRTQN